MSEVAEQPKEVPRLQQNKDNLFSKAVRAERRSFFLDVRENARGIFVKLTESRFNRRSTILLSKTALLELITAMNSAITEDYEPLTQKHEESKWTTLMTMRVHSQRKRMYFDLKENTQGKVFTIAEISETHGKTSVMIPSASWKEMKTALEEVLTHFPDLDEKENAGGNNLKAAKTRKPREPAEEPLGGNSKVVATKKLFVRSKRFFFDYLENDMGRYLRLSEARGKRKDTIHLASDCLDPVIAFLRNIAKEDYTTEVDGLTDYVEEENPEVERKYKVLLSKSMIVAVVEKSDDEGEEPEITPEARKYLFELRENDHGKFLRLGETRVNSSKTSAVFISEENLEEVAGYLQEFLEIE